MKLVLIEWIDAYGVSPSWEYLHGHDPKPLKVKSVGWLLHDKEDCKVVVPHVTDVDHEHIKTQGCGDMTIPVRAIIKITELGPK